MSVFREDEEEEDTKTLFESVMLNRTLKSEVRHSIQNVAFYKTKKRSSWILGPNSPCGLCIVTIWFL